MSDEIKNDMMPIGMPPVMVDYEDFSHLMALDDRFKEQAEEIQRLQNPWIPVTERLPESRGGVIVYCPNSKYEKVFSAIFNGVFHTGHDKVTHWMALPEPPQEQEE